MHIHDIRKTLRELLICKFNKALFCLPLIKSNNSFIFFTEAGRVIYLFDPVKIEKHCKSCVGMTYQWQDTFTKTSSYGTVFISPEGFTTKQIQTASMILNPIRRGWLYFRPLTLFLNKLLNYFFTREISFDTKPNPVKCTQWGSNSLLIICETSLLTIPLRQSENYWIIYTL